MDETWRKAIEGLAGAGIRGEVERSESGQLELTICGESVDSWEDEDGLPWVIIAIHEST